MRRALIVLLLTAVPAKADDRLWGDAYDALVGQPGVEVSLSTGEDGQQHRAFQLPNQVSLSQTRGKGSLGVDRSGKGALLCVWEIYLAMRLALEACDGMSFPAHAAALDQGLERLQAFIVQHSYGVWTLEAIADRRKAKIDRMLRGKHPGAARVDCSRGGFRGLPERLTRIPAVDIAAELDQTMSVPRFPVMNPCL